MFHFLLFILFIVVFVLVATLAVGAYVLRKGIGLFRNTAGNVTGKKRHGGPSAGGRGGREWHSGRASHSGDGPVIIDARDAKTANRRIFADDEGEYVDYEEK